MRPRSPASWPSCAGPSTPSRRSGSTCPGPRRRCWPRWTGCRWRSPRGGRSARSPRCCAAARPGGTVLLRGDMDALPVTERTGLPYASGIDGAMHACGHDLHTAMLAGAARLLSARRDELRRERDLHVPARRGGRRRGREDDRRGRARRGRAPGRSPRSGCTSLGRAAPRAVHEPGRDADGGGRHAGGDGPRPRRARVAAAPGRRPRPRRLRDRDRAADAGHPAVRRVRPGRDHRGQLSRGHRRAT